MERMSQTATRASTASEPRERSAPAKRRARERAGESEGRSPSGLVRERPEEGRALVLIGRAHFGAIDPRQGIEPLLVAAARVVVEVFFHRQLHGVGRDGDLMAV